MDWHGNPNTQLVHKTDNHNLASFLYNCNFNHSPGIEMRYQVGGQVAGQHGVMPVMEMSINSSEMNGGNGNYIQEMKKKRLTSEQLDSLESSFQEDIKLDPDRKTRLAKELGLQPRQIAVWFQNRRARWKSKQLERLYDALKQEFDLVSREKQKLQEEVIALRSIVRQQANKKQGSTTINYTEMSGEETVESTSQNRIIPSGNYALNIVDDYNPGNVIPTSSNYWPILPPYPSNI